MLGIDIEFATKVVKMEFLNYSANTGVYIKKTDLAECMPGDTIRYDIKAVRKHFLKNKVGVFDYPQEKFF